MNKKIIFLVLLVCLLAFVAVLAFAQNSTNVRWEYISVTVTDADQANWLGKEGWELTAATEKYGTIYQTLFFKRRLP